MSSKTPVIKLKDIHKIYKMGEAEVSANNGIDLEVRRGEFLVIMGRSGSGKSTLMNIIGCLDRPTSGSYILAGNEVSELSDDELALVRNKKIGFVFQKFHLLAGTTAEENVELPMIYAGMKTKERVSICKDSLEKVSLTERAGHVPAELSGGQKQRVAIARALVNNPSIILADEPTGNLDSKSGREIMAIFQDLHRQGKTIVLITHNREMTKYGTRVVHLHDGKIISDEEVNREKRIISQAEDYSKTSEKFFLKGRRMNFLQNLKIAWKALRANKMRSILTMLGVIIGVAAVIVMISIGEGTKQNELNWVYSRGSNLINIYPPWRRSVLRNRIGSQDRFLTMRDVYFIKEKCDLIKGVAPEISNYVTVRYLSNNHSTTLTGSTSDYFKVNKFPIENGRIFNDEENKNRATVCVLGSFVAKKLFGKDNPAGKTIRLSLGSEEDEKSRAGIRLIVIGVMAQKGETSGEYWDDQVVVPLDTVKYRIFNQRNLEKIALEAESFENINDAIKQVKRAILPLHGNSPENIEIRGQKEMVERAEKTWTAFTFMLGGIAFMSLLVGGIGIMNIMLVSVTERTKEIGLRKAIGAKESDILFQFLVESSALCVTGGIIGIIAGIALSRVYTIITATSAIEMLSETIISINSIIIAFSFSVMVGVFFGLYPARKAARLDPIEALRRK